LLKNNKTKNRHLEKGDKGCPLKVRREEKKSPFKSSSRAID